MANLSYIDIERSISRSRLVYKRSWLDILDKVVFSVLCISMMTYPSLVLFRTDLNNPNDKVLAMTILSLAILFGLYGLYRKLTETKLLRIETSFARHKNKEMLLAFLKQRSHEIFRQNKEVIIVTDEEDLSLNKLWTKTITFIISDQVILFNIVKNYPKLNPPVLSSHFFLKRDLKKFVADYEMNEKSLYGNHASRYFKENVEVMSGIQHFASEEVNTFLLQLETVRKPADFLPDMSKLLPLNGVKKIQARAVAC